MYAEAPAFHLKKKKKENPEVRRAPKNDLRVQSQRFILQNKGKNFFPSWQKKQKQSKLHQAPQREKNKRPHYMDFTSEKTNHLFTRSTNNRIPTSCTP